MWTIGQLAKDFALSRSSLIYYDTQGLLRPSQRSASGYRLYTAADKERLTRILLFRKAGMPLADIARILDKDKDQVETALEQRLFSINAEIQSLREQQQVILTLLQKQHLKHKARLITKSTWVDMLRQAGLDDTGMRTWHRAFEASAPEAHQDFLESLGIDTKEIKSIRAWSKHEQKN